MIGDSGPPSIRMMKPDMRTALSTIANPSFLTARINLSNETEGISVMEQPLPDPVHQEMSFVPQLTAPRQYIPL